MVDALDLFDNIITNEHLMNSAVILFFNKIDVFVKKIEHTSITVSPAFKDYTGILSGFDNTQLLHKL